MLRFIAEAYSRNLTAMDIEDGLSRMVARNIEFEEVTTTTAAARPPGTEGNVSRASSIYFATEKG